MPLTLEQSLNIFGQIATWSTLIIIYITLLEMRAQRRSAYQPDLFPVDALTTIIVGGSCVCTWQKDIGLPKNIPQELDNFNIQIINIGLGPAKNIRCTWSFNSEILFQELSNKDFSRFFKSFAINKGGWNLTSAQSNTINNQGMIIMNLFSQMGINVIKGDNEEETEISTISTTDYQGLTQENTLSHSFGLVQKTGVLLPLNVIKNDISLTLPQVYSMYFGLLLSTIAQAENGRSGDYLDRLNNQVFLKLDLDYEDIAGNKYSRKYKCKFLLFYQIPIIKKHFVPISGKLIFSNNK